jgi:hypothetical protein
MNVVPARWRRRASSRKCLRCKGDLHVTDRSGDLVFLACERCGRRFTEESGTLTERWLGPLTLALYGIQFDPHPQARAADTADGLQHLDTAAIAAIAAEIRLELSEPSQSIRDLLGGMAASEQDLREFLGLLADELEHRLR